MVTTQNRTGTSVRCRSNICDDRICHIRLTAAEVNQFRKYKIPNQPESRIELETSRMENVHAYLHSGHGGQPLQRFSIYAGDNILMHIVSIQTGTYISTLFSRQHLLHGQGVTRRRIDGATCSSRHRMQDHRFRCKITDFKSLGWYHQIHYYLPGTY